MQFSFNQLPKQLHSITAVKDGRVQVW